MTNWDNLSIAAGAIDDAYDEVYAAADGATLASCVEIHNGHHTLNIVRAIDTAATLPPSTPPATPLFFSGGSMDFDDLEVRDLISRLSDVANRISTATVTRAESVLAAAMAVDSLSFITVRSRTYHVVDDFDELDCMWHHMRLVIAQLKQVIP